MLATRLDQLAFLDWDEEHIFNRRQAEHLKGFQCPETPAGADAGFHSLYLILKATRLCNLRCTYCHAWRDGPNQVLSFEHLVSVIAQAMRLPGVRWLHVVWHGGETTLLSRRYFQRALWLQEYFRIDSRKVGHSIQTNATRLDEDWCRFFAAAGFSVGVSADFDPESHDLHRRYADGRGSFADVSRGVALLEAHGVPHGWLAVVDERVLAIGARGMLERLVAQGVRNVGLLNALPDNAARERAVDYLPWDRFVAFLRDVFREWQENFRDRLVIRELDNLRGIVQGAQSRLCLFQGGCMGQYLTIEPDGRVSACDKYVGDPAYEFGNLAKQTLYGIVTGSKPLQAARETARQALETFSACGNYRYCRGGCPHDARLNSWFQPQSGCCGLHDLIEDMKHCP